MKESRTGVLSRKDEEDLVSTFQKWWLVATNSHWHEWDSRWWRWCIEGRHCLKVEFPSDREINPKMTKSLNIWLNTQCPWASPSVLIIALLICVLQFVYHLMSRKYTHMWHTKILSIYSHQRAPRLYVFTQNYNNIEVSNIIIIIRCNIK